jgi:hypothetical protein
VPSPAPPAYRGIEYFAAEGLAKENGVHLLGEAVNEVSLIVLNDRMMRFLTEIPAKLRDGGAISAGASVGGQDDLIGKLAIKPGLGVLPFTPRHCANPLHPYSNWSGTSPKVLRITASSNSPRFGSPLREKAIAPTLGSW